MMIYDSLSKSERIVLIKDSEIIENKIKDLSNNRGRASFLMAQNFQFKEVTMSKEDTSDMLDNKSWLHFITLISLWVSSNFSCLINYCVFFMFINILLRTFSYL